MGALFSSLLKSLNFVSLRLNLEVFKVAQSKLSHILTRPIRTSVERMGLGQECEVSVSMIANDRAQISQAHVQDGLCLCCLLL